MARTTDQQRTAGSSRPAAAAFAATDRDSLNGDDQGEDTLEETGTWRDAAVFGAGLALGLALGAGAALLSAPLKGADARKYLGKRVSRLRDHAEEQWDDLRDDAGYVAHRGRRKAGRVATRGRWSAEDIYDRGRRKVGL